MRMRETCTQEGKKIPGTSAPWNLGWAGQHNLIGNEAATQVQPSQKHANGPHTPPPKRARSLQGEASVQLLKELPKEREKEIERLRQRDRKEEKGRERKRKKEKERERKRKKRKKEKERERKRKKEKERERKRKKEKERERKRKKEKERERKRKKEKERERKRKKERERGRRSCSVSSGGGNGLPHCFQRQAVGC